jgi:hypothetical protein
MTLASTRSSVFREPVEIGHFKDSQETHMQGSGKSDLAGVG